MHEEEAMSMIQKHFCLLWAKGKLFYGQMNQNLTFFFGKHGHHIPQT